MRIDVVTIFPEIEDVDGLACHNRSAGRTPHVRGHREHAPQGLGLFGVRAVDAAIVGLGT